MSEAFDLFFGQYNATGRAKLDGYTLSNLSLLTQDEREKVIQLLRDEADHFSGAYEPLAFLDKDVAVETLRQIEGDLPDREYRGAYEVYFWLWKTTQDESYVNKFIQSKKYVAESSLTAFYVRAREMSDFAVVEDFLRQAIIVEMDENSRGLAARILLNNYGYSRDNPDTKEAYLTKWRGLQDGSLDQKKKILSGLKRDFGKPQVV